jgi:hypothetical protein
VTVECRPVNDFGYIGWAKGTVEVGERSGDVDGSLKVKGRLQLRYNLFGAPETAKEVELDGKVDKDGQWMGGDIVAGAPELESVFFSFLPDVDSRIDAPNLSPSYQTRCVATDMNLPRGSDLVPEDTIRVTHNGDGTGAGDGTLTVRVYVVNVGNEPAYGATGRAKVGGGTVSAKLVENGDFVGATPDTIRAGARGWVEVVIPEGAIIYCTRPLIDIDVDGTFQSGEPDPFGNDASSASAPCLTWTTPITRDALDFEPDPFLVGKTLGNIVSSKEIGRKDNALCSACHNSAIVGNPYHPPVAPGQSATINSTDVILGKTWTNEWAAGFLTTQNSPKPDYLKAIVQQWLDDGAFP